MDARGESQAAVPSGGAAPNGVAPDVPESGPMPEHVFTATLWVWDARKQDTWTFVTVPAEATASIEDEADARGPRGGFGSVKVEVRIAATSWHTSVFPDAASGLFVLPIKRSVREANGLDLGDAAIVHLRVR